MFFTSESVTEGHPDKICDQISDAVLDAIMEKDPMGRVACETVITTGLVMVLGEITTSSYVDIQKIVRETIRGIGYTRAKFGFDCDTCGVITSINEQSADIALGVDNALESKEGLEEKYNKIGAGDQGMVFGYATNETEEYMPMPIVLAHKLTKRLSEVRKDKTLEYLRPDGKSQVTVEYSNGKVKRIDTVVISSQHSPKVSSKQIKENIREVLVARDMLSCEDDSCRALIAQASRTAGSVEGLDAGDVVRFGTFEVHVTWPHAFAADGGNADSVCFFLSCDVDADGAGDYRALFTGDAEISQLESFLDLEGGDAVDVLKVCHHGSRNGLDERIARTLHPRIALISVGARNTYGHPAPEVLGLLDGVGAEVFRTDEDGDVSCEFTRAGIDVTTQR